MFADSSFVTFITAVNLMARVLFSNILIYAETSAVPNKTNVITNIDTLSVLHSFFIFSVVKIGKGKFLITAIAKQTLSVMKY